MFDWHKIVASGYDAKPAQHWPVYQTGEALDRTQYVTASEIGKCARQVKFAKESMKVSGYVPEDGTNQPSSIDWGYFERGHTVEAWVVQIVRDGFKGSQYEKDGWELLFTGEDQVSFVDDCQSGTPDGAIVNKRLGLVRALEFKSIDPRTNKNRLPKQEHVKQTMQNLDLMATVMDLIPSGGDLIYIDASNYKDILSYPVKWDPDMADQLFQRANWIMAAETPADLPDEGIYVAGVCKQCNFKRECSAVLSETRNENGETRHENLNKASTGLFNK